jgi:hypothetical protein
LQGYSSSKASDFVLKALSIQVVIGYQRHIAGVGTNIDQRTTIVDFKRRNCPYAFSQTSKCNEEGLVETFGDIEVFGEV